MCFCAPRSGKRPGGLARLRRARNIMRIMSVLRSCIHRAGAKPALARLVPENKKAGMQSMTDKELRHLSRAELIDIIYELQKQNQAAAEEIEQLREALDEKELRLANAGSIAEAALSLNGVFEAAQAAADQYLLSVRALQAQDVAAEQD